jgi:hypothetical protein
MGQRSDFMVSEGYDAVSGRRLSHLVGLFGVLEGLPGMLVCAEVFLLPMFLTGAMGMGGEVVQFSSPLVIFVVGSVVIARRHIQRVTICPDLAWASLASL